VSEHEAESIRREMSQAVADSIIDALEAHGLALANAIRAVQDDQAKAREEIYALVQRVDALERKLTARSRRLA